MAADIQDIIYSIKGMDAQISYDFKTKKCDRFANVWLYAAEAINNQFGWTCRYDETTGELTVNNANLFKFQTNNSLSNAFFEFDILVMSCQYVICQLYNLNNRETDSTAIRNHLFDLEDFIIKSYYNTKCQQQIAYERPSLDGLLPPQKFSRKSNVQQQQKQQQERKVRQDIISNRLPNFSPSGITDPISLEPVSQEQVERQEEILKQFGVHGDQQYGQQYGGAAANELDFKYCWGAFLIERKLTVHPVVSRLLSIPTLYEFFNKTLGTLRGGGTQSRLKLKEFTQQFIDALFVNIATYETLYGYNNIFRVNAYDEIGKQADYDTTVLNENFGNLIDMTGKRFLRRSVFYNNMIHATHEQELIMYHHDVTKTFMPNVLNQKNIRFFESLKTEWAPHIQSYIIDKELAPVTVYLRVRGISHRNTFNVLANDQSNDPRNLKHVRLDWNPSPSPLKLTGNRNDSSNNVGFTFGPFTEYFSNSVMTNEDIASHCRLINDNVGVLPILVFGYGSSGSGKTSTLIGYDGSNGGQAETGVLFNIINKRVIDKTLLLTIYEYYVTDNEYNTNNPERVNSSQTITSLSDIVFTKHDGRGFVSDHIAVKAGSGSIDLRFPVGTALGAMVSKTIDDFKGRKISGTPNNPTSSRSHVLVKITFPDSPTAPFFIADYAGVENEFNCESVRELLAFANIKDLKSKTNPMQRFYRKERVSKDAEKYHAGKCTNWGRNVIHNSAASASVPIKQHAMEARILDAGTYLMDGRVWPLFFEGYIKKHTHGTKTSLSGEELEARQARQGKRNVKLTHDGGYITRYNAALKFACEPTLSPTPDESLNVAMVFIYPDHRSHFSDQGISMLTIDELDMSFNPDFFTTTCNDGFNKNAVFCDVIFSCISDIVDGIISQKINNPTLRNMYGNIRTHIHAPSARLRNILKATPALAETHFHHDELFFMGLKLTNSAPGVPIFGESDLIPFIDRVYTSYQNCLNNRSHTIFIKKPQDVLNIMYDVFKARHRYFRDVITTLKSMRIVCECRLKEGKYINDTLAHLRNDISNIVSYKQNTFMQLRRMPLIHSDCYTQLCDNTPGGDCYDYVLPDDIYAEATPTNMIMNEIITHGIDLHDLKIVVFGIFDNTSKMNDRPAQPYIPIQELLSAHIKLKKEELYHSLGERFKLHARPNFDLNDFRPAIMLNTYLEWVHKYRNIMSHDEFVSITDLCSELDTNYTKERLERLIKIQVNMNRISPIGSLEFLDFMAKNAIKGPESSDINITTCITTHPSAVRIPTQHSRFSMR